MTHIITGLDDGGAEAVLYRLCAHDRSNRHTVVSLRDDGKYGPLLRELGTPVHCLHLSPTLANPSRLFQLWRLLREEKPDVVQTWMYHADLIGGTMARLAGVRAVAWGVHHTTLEWGKSKITTILVARFSALLSHWVPRRVVCCAQSTAAIHGGLGYAPKKLVVIHNGYSLDHFRPSAESGLALRRELGVPDDALLIGMVARFDSQKDHHNLLSALAILQERGREVYCLLVGRDADRTNERLTDWIEELRLSDRVLPLGQRPDINAVMNALDVHALSSSYGEAFPNVLAEAMACGTPCVATDVGDSQVIIGETGWIVPAKDAAALAVGLLEALSAFGDPLGWRQRQEICRRRIQELFSVEAMAAKYEEAWRQCSST